MRASILFLALALAPSCKQGEDNVGSATSKDQEQNETPLDPNAKPPGPINLPGKDKGSDTGKPSDSVPGPINEPVNVTGEPQETASGNGSGSTTNTPTTIAIVGTVALTNAADLTAVALPVTGGVLDLAAMRSPPQAALAGGQLALEIPAGSALALADGDAGGATATLIALFQAPVSGKRMDLIDSIQFIEMPVAGADALVGLPTSEAKTGEIALGAIDVDADGKVFTATAATDDVFDATAAELLGQARADDTMKGVKNAFVNTDPTSGTYFVPHLSFLWKGLLDLTMAGDDEHLLAPSLNQASATGSEDFPRFFGYSIAIRTNDAQISYEKQCQDLATLPDMQLLPPEPFQVISEHETDFTDDTTLDMTAWDAKTADKYENQADRRSCVYQKAHSIDANGSLDHQNLDLMAFRNRDQETEILFGGPRVVYGPAKLGVWELKKDGATLAKFDLAVSDAVEVVTANGTDYRKPIVFVPAIQIVKAAGTDEIEKVRVRLYQYRLDLENPAASAFELVPMGTVAKFVHKVDLYLNNSGRDSAERHAGGEFQPSALDAAATFGEVSDENMRTFLFPPLGTSFPAGKEKLWSVGIGYEMFGSRYEVRLRCGGTGDTTARGVACEP